VERLLWVFVFAALPFIAVIFLRPPVTPVNFVIGVAFLLLFFVFGIAFLRAKKKKSDEQTREGSS
jgi:peptidoglycan/LPS O-acetylase OafA/YrhL